MIGRIVKGDKKDYGGGKQIYLLEGVFHSI